MHYFEYKDDTLLPCERELVVEEPLRIVVNDEPLAVLMRTPGNELDLAIGLLLSEQVIQSVSDISSISFCPDGDLGDRNEVRVVVPTFDMDPIRLPGQQLVMSSCGICGSYAIESASKTVSPFSDSGERLSVEDIFALSDEMVMAQREFKRSGATHAAAFSELPLNQGHPIFVQEDIGRHNALDKVVGAAACRGVIFERGLLFLSGRISFEMIAKAARAGIPNVSSISAPTALAVCLAAKLNMFLAGFVRERAMTIYSGHNVLRG